MHFETTPSPANVELLAPPNWDAGDVVRIDNGYPLVAVDGQPIPPGNYTVAETLNGQRLVRPRPLAHDTELHFPLQPGMRVRVRGKGSTEQAIKPGLTAYGNEIPPDNEYVVAYVKGGDEKAYRPVVQPADSVGPAAKYSSINFQETQLVPVPAPAASEPLRMRLLTAEEKAAWQSPAYLSPPAPRPAVVPVPPPSIPTPHQAERPPEQTLSPEEQRLTELAAQYAELTPVEAQLTPELRDILRRHKDHFFFAGYVLDKGDLKSSVCNPDKVSIRPQVEFDLLTQDESRGLVGTAQKLQSNKGVLTSFAYRPVYASAGNAADTHSKKKNRAIPYGEAVTLAPGDMHEDEQAVRITWHVSNFERYRINTTNFRPAGVTAGQNREGMFIPQGRYVGGSGAQQEKINDLITARNTYRALIAQPDQVSKPPKHWPGRPGNYIALSVVLPKSEAEALWTSLQQGLADPGLREQTLNQFESFFIQGSLPFMVPHTPPPDSVRDRRRSQVMLRKFNDDNKTPPEEGLK